MPKHSAFPEFLERHDLDAGTWDVSPSYVPRTDIENRKMGIPVGDDDQSRALRVRELMRAKVSPEHLFRDHSCSRLINDQILDACETQRLNALLRHRGLGDTIDNIDTRGLSVVIDRAVAARDVNSIVELVIRSYGTKGQRNITRAVKNASEKHSMRELPAFVKELNNVLKRSVDRWASPRWGDVLGSTSPVAFAIELNEENADESVYVDGPSGYQYTIGLANAIDNFLASSTNPTATFDPKKEGEIPDEASMPIGFAPLILDKLPLTERVAGRMGRKRSATNVGINPRRIHRYLVDPEKRIFDKRIKGIGGVVLIDQSGSMSLSTDEIWDIIKASPGCTIIGYSDNCRGEGTPNTWVLAENGKVVSEVRYGNGGNGVDGPALLYAISKRKKGEPLIWVCDGYVTGAGDGHQPTLAKWCSKVVMAAGVHMCEDVPDAIEALKRVRSGEKLPMRGIGPIKAAINDALNRGA